METAIRSAKILLPKSGELTKWSVIACDQFTSEIEYWQRLEEEVKGEYSTLNLIYPEIYLEDNTTERIAKINSTMDSYLNSGVLKELEEGFILTIRSTPYTKRRIGLVCALDLEQYEYKKGSKSLIRATEATIEERIPPRVRIREKAKIELPHIMVLFDDEKRSIIEPLYENRNSYEKVYDFDLNMDGGHIEGYYIKDTQEIIEKFEKLLEEERLIKRYGESNKFLFAVGDGNHSLATAKTHWENVKKGLNEEDQKTHPARYALVEIVNIFDEGIAFEPIYRYVVGVEPEKFLSGLVREGVGTITVYTNGEEKVIEGENNLPTKILKCDEYVKEYITNFGGKVDYVHGDGNLKNLVDANKQSVGIKFEKLDKNDLFKFVVEKGALPKKTFSMGEAVEKRYYLEGKKIVK